MKTPDDSDDDDAEEDGDDEDFDGTSHQGHISAAK
jgi:hypothetical protein